MIPTADDLADMPKGGTDFCEAPGLVPFAITEGVDVQIAMSVTVASMSEPMPVTSGGSQIGVIDDTLAVALRGCMSMGFEFVGEVRRVDRAAGSGTLALRGITAGAS